MVTNVFLLAADLIRETIPNRVIYSISTHVPVCCERLGEREGGYFMTRPMANPGFIYSKENMCE
jgi:hypothetical protein